MALGKQAEYSTLCIMSSEDSTGSCMQWVRLLLTCEADLCDGTIRKMNLSLMTCKSRPNMQQST